MDNIIDPKFSGSDYVKVFDLARLTGQIKHIYTVMSDGKWRTLSEIEEDTKYPQASISAQLRNLRKSQFGGFVVNKRRRGDDTQGLFEYKLLVPKPDPRDPKQQEIVNAYCEQSPVRATMVLATGFGKSKVVIDIIKRKQPKRVLILVNSSDLKDFSWRDEFRNFGMGHYYDKFVVMQTYQTAYKWIKEEVNLENFFVVVDECDFAADVPELSKFFYEFPLIPMLGVTGFITEDKKQWFATYLPVIVEYSIADAQRDGLLNKMHFVFVRYELNKAKNVKVDYSKGSFMTSENDQYAYLDNKFRNLIIRKEILAKQAIEREITLTEYEREMARNDYLIQKVSRDRKQLLMNNDTNVMIVNRLLAMHDENDKTVIFSIFTKQSEKLTDFVYNGRQSDKKNRENFSKFNSGKIKTLGVCSKINRGVNIRRLNVAIFESFYGSDTQATQRLGRLARLNPGEVSTIYIMLPYYRKQREDGTFEVKETQQVKYARDMLKTTELTSYDNIDYRNL